MEKEMTTRDRIIFQSLKLFSEKGYDGVSMREIAAAAGIKGASLYNHFKSKEAIFEAVFDEMKRRLGSAADMLCVPFDENDETAALYRNADVNTLLQMAEGLFSFFARDDFAVSFRRLLVSEQFKAPAAEQCYREYYLEAPFDFQAGIFTLMQRYGDFSGYDPDVLALHFYSPIFFILSRYDNGFSYDECLELIKKHVLSFTKAYKSNPQ